MRALHVTAAAAALWTLTTAQVAAAETATAVDGTFTIDLPSGWSLDEDGQLKHGRDAMRVRLQGSHDTAGLQPADLLHGLASKDDAGVVTYTWSGRDKAERTAGCIDTRKATGNLKPDLRTWCAVETKPGTVAIYVMETRDIINARSHASTSRKLIDHVQLSTATPATEAPPESGDAAAPVTWDARLHQDEGYRCFKGRWNPDGPPDDLRVYWKADSREMVVRFKVFDGADAQLYYLGGTMDVGKDEWFGHLDRFEGPASSKSGIHRFFAGLDAQGAVVEGAITSFRTTQDRDFTKLGACPEGD